MPAKGQFINAATKRPNICGSCHALSLSDAFIVSGESVTGVVRVLVGLASLGAHVIKRSYTARSHILQVGLTHTKV
jgi:hypothetical protein